jgi:hypothetical protein
MLTAIFGFIRDMAWELVALQMNPFLGLMILAVAGVGVWSALQLMRR